MRSGFAAFVEAVVGGCGFEGSKLGLQVPFADVARLACAVELIPEFCDEGVSFSDLLGAIGFYRKEARSMGGAVGCELSLECGETDQGSVALDESCSLAAQRVVHGAAGNGPRSGLELLKPAGYGVTRGPVNDAIARWVKSRPVAAELPLIREFVGRRFGEARLLR